MVFGLDKLFGKKDAPPPFRAVPRLFRRTAVFDQEHELAGHCIHREPTPAGLAFAKHHATLEDALLNSLCDEAPSAEKLPLFVPLDTAFIDHPCLDRLPARVIPLLRLAPKAEASGDFAARLAQLARHRRLGCFRQPRHPAFATALLFSSFAVIDIAESQGGDIRDFSIALRSGELGRPLTLFAAHIETPDDLRLCRQCQFDLFEGASSGAGQEVRGDPHKLHLIHLTNLVQGNADFPRIASVIRQDPLLVFRLLRHLGALGVERPITSIEQALNLLSRKRFERWLSILLFSVKDPELNHWLMVESALVRGRFLQIVGGERFPAEESDALFITGLFSRLDRLLHLPLAQAIEAIPLPERVRDALLTASGPYAPLLAVAAASEAGNAIGIEAATEAARLNRDKASRAFINASTWANDITGHW